jgi:hypothetical protein
VNEDGSTEYNADRDGIEDLEENIRRYDDFYERRGR